MAIQTIDEENRLCIVLLTLPTHTTHILQPIDVSVFGPFKSYFRGERATWMEMQPEEEVNKFELDELARNTGFRQTRI